MKMGLPKVSVGPKVHTISVKCGKLFHKDSLGSGTGGSDRVLVLIGTADADSTGGGVLGEAGGCDSGTLSRPTTTP